MLVLNDRNYRISGIIYFCFQFTINIKEISYAFEKKWVPYRSCLPQVQKIHTDEEKCGLILLSSYRKKYVCGKD